MYTRQPTEDKDFNAFDASSTIFGGHTCWDPFFFQLKMTGWKEMGICVTTKFNFFGKKNPTTIDNSNRL